MNTYRYNQSTERFFLLPVVNVICKIEIRKLVFSGFSSTNFKFPSKFQKSNLRIWHNQKHTFILLILLLVNSFFPVESHAASLINLSVISRIESSNNPKAYNKKSGCIGLYQINPRGALADWNKAFPRNKYSSSDLFNPEINKKIADFYFNVQIPKMLNYYKKPVDVKHIIWAYNAGIGNVVRGNMPLETRRYIEKYKKLS